MTMRLTDFSFLTALVCLVPGFLIACASSRINVLPLIGMEPFVLLHHRVGRDHEIEFVQLMGFFRLHTIGIVSSGVSGIKL